MRKAREAELREAASIHGIEHVPQASPTEDDRESVPYDTPDLRSGNEQFLNAANNILQGELLRAAPNYDPNIGERLTIVHGEYMAIIGTYEVEVLSGILTLAGAALRPGSGKHRVTTLNTNPVLYCVIGPAEIALYHLNDGFKHLETFSSMFMPSSQPLSTLYMPETHTFSKVRLHGFEGDEDSNGSLILSVKPRLFDSNERLNAPRDWRNEIARLISQVTGNNAGKDWLNEIGELYRGDERPDTRHARNIIQICGAPRGGKFRPNGFQYKSDCSSTSYSRFANRVDLGITTFTSLLINNIHACIRKSGGTSALGFIDLNINAPLFGPPGQLSLTILRRASFGDAFANAITTGDNEIIRAHAVPPDAYQENPDHFIACVRDLMESASGMRHLLIQCPTSRNGTDLEKNNAITSLVSEYKSFARAEAIAISVPEYYIQAFNQHQIPVEQLNPDENYARLSERNATQLHDMQLISYFHASLSSTGSIQWDAEPLQYHTPVIVNYGPSSQDIAGIFIFSSVPHMYPKMLTTLLDGSLVQIIVISKEASPLLQKRKILSGEEDDIPYFPNNANGYTEPFDPKISECVGVALIRKIDTKNKRLYLLTPIPQAKLDTLPHKRTVLAFGAFETPRWAYEEKKHWEQQVKFAKQKEGQKAHAEGDGVPSPNLLEKLQHTLDEEMARKKGKRTYADVMAAEADERVKAIIGTMAPKRARQ